MAKNVLNSRLFSARNFILAENTQFRSSPLLVAATRYGLVLTTRTYNGSKTNINIETILWRKTTLTKKKLGS